MDKFTLWGMFLIVGNAGAPGTDPQTVTDGQVAAFCGCNAVAGGLGLDAQKPPPRNFSVAAAKVPRVTGGKGATLKISLLSYLLLVLETWQSGITIDGVQAPQRWIEWLTLLISHYGRYTPTQIYGFLARVNFADATFKV